MNILDLSYQILTGGEHELLVAENLIENARWLEEQGLVRCMQEECGMRIQLNLKGIDAWMQNKLKEINVYWIPIQLGTYGVASKNKAPAQFVEDRRSAFNMNYSSLWIEPCDSLFLRLPRDTPVHFAEFFCGKKQLASVVQHIANQGKISLCLEMKETEILLAGAKFVHNSSVLRKNLIGILVEHQVKHQKLMEVPFLSFDDLAKQLYEKYEIYVESIKKQIYKTLHDLQIKALKQNPHIGLQGFIEIQKGTCRFHPHIFCMTL
jgi:hypothetical protein